jgi:hypothetical protein
MKMKIKSLTVLITVLVLFVFTLFGNYVFFRSATAQKNDRTQNTTNQTKSTKFSNNENKTKKQIPDRVAYELFLRTVGEFNARGLIEHAGFKENEVDVIVGNAKSLNEILNSNDEAARRIKENKTNLSASNVKTELAKIQANKNETIDRTVNRYLSNSLRTEGMSKLKDFIDSEVKNNIQVIPKPKSESSKGEVAFIKTSTRSSLQSSGNLYLYSAAWQDNMDVFGSGTLSEEYESQTSYKTIVTVTSPSGRSNTTESDWDYATITHNTGLSIGMENGSYTVQADFEQAEGYYDEYKNFITTGGTNVGTAFNSAFVRPIISISAVSPPEINFDRISTMAKSSTANIALSADVSGFPLPVYITVGLGKQSGGNFYTVNGRLRERIPHNNPGMFVTATYSFTPDLNVQTSDNAVEQFLITRVERRTGTTPQGEPIYTELNPMTDFQYGTRSMNITLSIPAPQTGGGGGSTSSVCTGLPGGSSIPGISGCVCPNTTGVGSCPAGTAFQSTGGAQGMCCYSSPLLLDIDGDGYEMTDYYYGVPFDVSGKGYATQTSWTAASSDDAWIVLDRNQNNRIDNGTEMFGDASEQPVTQNPRNGFSSLAMFDKPNRGGNDDGKITRHDRVFKKLRLWQDRNHNGISEPEELSRLPALDVVAVFLDYQESRRVDKYDNWFRFRARVRDRNGARVGRWAWDVFLVISPPNNLSWNNPLLK